MTAQHRKIKSESVKVSVAQSCPTLCEIMAVAHLGALSIGFPRQKYWSGLPFPSPGDLPDPGIEPEPPALQILYHLSHQESPRNPSPMGRQNR